MGFYTKYARCIDQANAQEKHAFGCVTAQLAQLARSMALERDRRQLEIVCLRDLNLTLIQHAVLAMSTHFTLF